MFCCVNIYEICNSELLQNFKCNSLLKCNLMKAPFDSSSYFLMLLLTKGDFLSGNV